MVPAAVLSILVQTQGVMQTVGQLSKLDAAGKKVGDSADNMAAKHAKGMDAIHTASKVGVVAVGALGAASINAAGNYEQSMNVFQAVTGATGKEMSKVGKLAIQLGADVKLPATSASDAATAMTELAKGGLSVRQSMGAARGVLQLSAAAQIDNAEAATITARALNAFNLKGKEAGRVADLLAATSNASTAEITDVAAAMQQASASASQLGVPIEDLTAAIGVMANAGIAGSDAGTSLKTMMARLTPETNKAADAFVRYGLATEDANGFHSKFFNSRGNFVGMEKAIALTQKALGGLSVEQRQQALNTLFGSDAQRAANIVLLGGAKNFDKMRDAVTKTGAAQELADAKTKGFKGALEGFKSTLETLAITFGTTLLPAATDVLRTFASWAGSLGEHKTLVLAVTGVIGGLSAAIVTVNLVTKAWAATTAAATAVQGAFNAVMAANPIMLVVVALAALAAAVVVAYKKSETFRAVVDAVWAFLKSFAGWLVNVGSAAFSWLAEAASKAWQVIKTVTETVWPVIKAYLQAEWAVIKAIATTAWGLIKAAIIDPVDAAFSWIKNAVGDVAAWLDKNLGKLTQPFVAAFEAISGAVEKVVGFLDDVIDRVKTAIDWIGKIKVPSINVPDLNPFGGAGNGTTVGPGNIGLLNSIQGIADYSLAWGLSGGRGPGQAFRPGDDGWHGQNRARDLSGPPELMFAFAKMLASTVGPRLLELIYTPLGFGIKNGQVVPNSFWGAGVLSDHFDHVHVAMANGGHVKESGWAVVGERGPELAHFPAGADVYSNSDSRRMLSGGGPMVVIEHAVIGSQRAAEVLANRLAYRAAFG